MVNSVNAYDVIVFGDEIYGVLAAVAAAREYRRRTKKYHMLELRQVIVLVHPSLILGSNTL